jgi:hypothetical protein
MSTLGMFREKLAARYASHSRSHLIPYLFYLRVEMSAVKIFGFAIFWGAHPVLKTPAKGNLA